MTFSVCIRSLVYSVLSVIPFYNADYGLEIHQEVYEIRLTLQTQPLAEPVPPQLYGSHRDIHQRGNLLRRKVHAQETADTQVPRRQVRVLLAQAVEEVMVCTVEVGLEENPVRLVLHRLFHQGMELRV